MLAQRTRQTFVSEGHQSRGSVSDLATKSRHGAGQQRGQGHRQVFLGEHADHAQCVTAQRKRVFVASGQVANTKHAHQGFQLVGQRHHHTNQVARQRVTGKTGFVMVFNGQGHLVTQAVMAGVVAAHDALQFGKLAHHVGQQIGLGQASGQVNGGRDGRPRRRAGDGRCSLQQGGNRRGNGPHPLGALALGAEFVVVDHLVEPDHAGRQRLLAVLVIKEFGVTQARTYHALVANDHGAGILGADVTDHEELAGELAGGIEQRKILLIGLHGQDQALLRHVQKLGLEFTHQHIGALHQRGHLVQQVIIR